MSRIVTEYLRHGIVVEPFSDDPAVKKDLKGGFTREQVDLLGTHFRSEGARKTYITNVTDFFKDKNIEISIAKDAIEDRTLLTPNFNFPEITFTFFGHKILMHESLTCCLGYARPKLWIGFEILSRKNDFPTVTKQLHGLIRARLENFREYYRKAIIQLSKDLAGDSHKHFGELSDEKLPFEKVRAFNIFSFGSKVSAIPKVLDGVSSIAYLRDFMASARTPESVKEVVKEVKALGSEILDDEDITLDDFEFHIAESFPVHKDSQTKSFVPVVSSNKEKLLQPRTAAIISAAYDEGSFTDEYSFTFGYEPDSIAKSKYSNAAMTSRTLMMELGRAY